MTQSIEEGIRQETEEKKTPKPMDITPGNLLELLRDKGFSEDAINAFMNGSSITRVFGDDGVEETIGTENQQGKS